MRLAYLQYIQCEVGLEASGNAGCCMCGWPFARHVHVLRCGHWSVEFVDRPTTEPDASAYKGPERGDRRFCKSGPRSDPFPLAGHRPDEGGWELHPGLPRC